MIDYDEFRTGLTFNEVRQMLKSEVNYKYVNGEYMFIIRHTVLGRWHQIKIKMYEEEIKIKEEYDNGY